MSTASELRVPISSVRVTNVRDSYGTLSELGASIRDEGMHHPVTLWKDGTLVSGRRRFRACLMLGAHDIPAVYIDSIEDAAQRLATDNLDDYLAQPMTGTEMCRMWELLRRLDEPAAVLRRDAARRRGVELRRETQAGTRPPGRDAGHSEDYTLRLLAPPFGLSATTAKRLWRIYSTAVGGPEVPADRREQARQAMKSIDARESSIFANYDRLANNRGPAPRPRAVEPAEPVPAARQITAWNKSLPQMEGLTAGLVELGPPAAELTWEQVGPVHARLMAVRRDLEKIINKMRETSKS